MKRSEIWLINLEPTIGAEIRKKRPAIVVNDDALGVLPLKVIVPITDWKEKFEVAPWMVKVEPDSTNNLSKVSAADCFQVRSVSERRLIKRIGKVDEDVMGKVVRALAKVLKMS
jgi:mRNA interferase MazF